VARDLTFCFDYHLIFIEFLLTLSDVFLAQLKMMFFILR